MIVGLSNPKTQYHKTRHNVGSWFVYYLAKRYLKLFKKDKKFFGFTSFFNIKSNCIRLLVPNIFMNLNGKSVFEMASFYNINLSEILIIHDDLELKPGVAKLKYSYGHNGHNGLRDVISTFNKKTDFYRFRIGIGRPINKHEISSFVLSNPNKIEEVLIKKSILHAIEETINLLTLRC
ncbi:MAG: aminoacyl-tRNA hydrolase [Buchnera aphidicola (Brevicoryne brassicae)]|uniref:Peptidyl-tRNA hydrolase n=1 Tax=Buchnera aphidicola (Brevicoryne brassicae) TaxID=911343 RepID=A0AAJ5TXW6_9GAMM|nr:aminoacyl-tRNA hydrolase [Buchnera aphidicola]QCI20144.1 aminoacyl-tRNA hydrolase [Buchnera aphidicola (Brevicoryne brassicae)]WAI19235.1 MAG: aminoacyl-tRNA hydrolase [Buchnera aphidicola (Brevicoryne brassicae)]